ncbi:hypothetical protein [Arcanobacterium canis]
MLTIYMRPGNAQGIAAVEFSRRIFSSPVTDFHDPKAMWSVGTTFSLEQILNADHHSIMRLENMVASLGTRRDTQNSRREYIESEMKELQSEMDKPSPYHEELADKREELTVVTREITRARKSGNAPEHQAHLSL